MRLARYSIFIYLILKPFYLFGSGGLQIADVFLVLAFFLFFIESWLSPGKKKSMVGAVRNHRFLIVFVLLVIAINATYFLILFDKRLLLSSLYYVFNLLAVVMFAVFLKDKKFIVSFSRIFKFNLLLQLAILVAGMGRYYSPDRYMGTFNDPNQLGYYILLSWLFIYAINFLSKSKWILVYYFVALYIIIQTGSTGMLMGMAVFSILATAYYIKNQLSSPYGFVKKIMYSLAAITVLILPVSVSALFIPNVQMSSPPNTSSNLTVFSRLEQKGDQASGESDRTLLEDRGLDAIVYYPGYLIFGSGEGAYTRFEKMANYGYEIHSTFPSMLFYYGIIPFGILLIWLYQNLRRIQWRFTLAIVSLFVVSFILLNQRQSLFWVFIILMPILSSRLPIGSKHEPMEKAKV